MTKMSKIFTALTLTGLIGFALPAFAGIKTTEVKKTEIISAVKAALKKDLVRMDIGQCNANGKALDSKKTVISIPEEGKEALSFDKIKDAESYPAVRKELVAAFSKYLVVKRGKEKLSIIKKGDKYLFKVKDSSCTVL